MKISEKYGLHKTQFELDFVDIDTERDTPLFIDPHHISNRVDDWSQSAFHTINSFFSNLVALLRSERIAEARRLFAYLSEPNETCLGLSQERPRGRGVGPENTQRVFDQIVQSGAVESGLVADIQDCLLFVEDFGPDKLSDMTTNIIRRNLIHYTQDQCHLWGIPLQTGVQSGHYWNPVKNEWENIHTEMLLVEEQRILLVPKSGVSYCENYTSQQYHRHFVLNFLQKQHLEKGSPLVQIKRNKRGEVTDRKVTKVSLIETEAPHSKDFLRLFTARHREVFSTFKHELTRPSVALSNGDITDPRASEEDIVTKIRAVCEHLKIELQQIPPGRENADRYHNIILGALELLFYPALTNPTKEAEIHDGRKRIDIAFLNAATQGFFHSLATIQDVPSRFIIVECKNYTNDIANPELDQLAGRFSANRGKVGIVTCRATEDRALLLSRCNDAWRDDRGLLLFLTDEDVFRALDGIKGGDADIVNAILNDRYREVAFS